MSEHAKLSPSAADRWSVCTASVAACEGYEDEPGPDAVKGTEAHELLERAILAKQHPKTIDPKHHSVAAVSIAYEQVEALLKDPAVQVFAEVVVKYTEDVWGTADIVVIKPGGTMVVIDYKNGVVPVEADCLQLLIYSAAALKTMAWLSPEPITEVGCIIIQPNGLDNKAVKDHKRTVGQVGREMNEKVLGAIETITGNDPEDAQFYAVSDKGCKWCPHGRAGNCGALKAHALDKVKAKFNDLGALTVPETDVVSTLSDEQIGEILKARPLIKMFLTAVEARGMNIAKSGGKVPGHKLVEGKKGNKTFTHKTEKETLEFLTKTLKFKKRDVVSEKIATPAAVSTLINGLKRNKEAKLKLFNEAVSQEEGKLALVSEDSKKKEVVIFQELPATDVGSVLG